jgi:hypothetical protein
MLLLVLLVLTVATGEQARVSGPVPAEQCTAIARAFVDARERGGQIVMRAECRSVKHREAGDT